MILEWGTPDRFSLLLLLPRIHFSIYDNNRNQTKQNNESKKQKETEQKQNNKGTKKQNNEKQDTLTINAQENLEILIPSGNAEDISLG